MRQNKYWRFAIEVTDALPVSTRRGCLAVPLCCHSKRGRGPVDFRKVKIALKFHGVCATHLRPDAISASLRFSVA
jgi:hypothetical protein